MNMDDVKKRFSYIVDLWVGRFQRHLKRCYNVKIPDAMFKDWFIRLVDSVLRFHNAELKRELNIPIEGDLTYISREKLAKIMASVAFSTMLPKSVSIAPYVEANWTDYLPAADASIKRMSEI